MSPRLLDLLPFHRASRVQTDFVVLHRSLCEACWCCVNACKWSVLGKVEMGSHRHAVIRGAEACTGCGACVKVCRAGALESRVAS